MNKSKDVNTMDIEVVDFERSWLAVGGLQSTELEEEEREVADVVNGSRR